MCIGFLTLIKNYSLLMHTITNKVDKDKMEHGNEILRIGVYQIKFSINANYSMLKFI